MTNSKWEAPRPQAGASRKRNIVLIVPLDSAYPDRSGRGTCRSKLARSDEPKVNQCQMDVKWLDIKTFDICHLQFVI